MLKLRSDLIDAPVDRPSFIGEFPFVALRQFVGERVELVVDFSPSRRDVPFAKLELYEFVCECVAIKRLVDQGYSFIYSAAAS